MKNYTILHLHSMDSNPYSGVTIDSITPFEDYIYKAKELGMKAIAFTEHGSVLHNVAKKQLCEKNGLKYILAEEFYVTEKIEEKLERDNYHVLLYAANEDGAKELRKLSSISMNRDDGHYYYNPRITLDELCNTSENIFVLTGCIAGILSKGTKEAKEKFLKFLINNKNRCWLEIQPHHFDYQLQYNIYLYNISQKYGLKLIATNDIHALNNEHLEGRAIMQKAKKIEFHDEDECDLSFKDYEQFVEAFKFQNALPPQVYLDAIEETNRFADLIEDFELDYSNKYPRPYVDSEQEFKNRIIKGIKERGIYKLPNYKSEYRPRIKEEFKTFKNNDAIDFMLLDSDYKIWMKENGMNYGPSRGSVSGSLIAYLIHNTDVDSVKYNLNFSRFMCSERQSLADVDTDIYAEDRYKVREYFFNRPGLYCCNIVTFNTIQMRGAIKDVCRALEMSVDEAQKISDMVYTDENGKDALPDSIKEQYPQLVKYVDIVKGTIVSLGRHAAGIVCSPIDVENEFGTLSISSDPRPVSQIDMHEIDSLNFVKMDLLGLNAVGLIDKACKLIGIDFLTPDMMDFSDENVIKSISEDTTLIFQFESGFASDGLKQTLSDESVSNIKKSCENASYLDIIAMVSGAIRPAGESYRDDLFKGSYRDNGNKALNDFLAPTLGQLVYQEQIIEFLNRFCGFTMGQADIVRRHFAKKTGTEADIPIIKDGGYMQDIHGNKDERYIKGFITIAQEEYGMSKEEAENVIVYFLEVIENASSYLFSKNHAVPYSMIGFMIGWLRYYYPLELLTAALNVYKDNNDKSAEIKKYINSQGIEIKGIKFGKSRAEYFMDKDENVIYQGIGSIAYCSYGLAEELYGLSINHFDKFLNLLIAMKDININSRQLDILIKLNFFSDFGEINNLLEQVKYFDTYYGKKVIKKDKTDLPEYLLETYCDKSTEKQYKFSDEGMSRLLYILCDNIDVKKASIRQKILWQKEFLGYVDITLPKQSDDLHFVLDVKGNLWQLYQMNNGTVKTLKCYKKTWSKLPVSPNDIIRITEIKDEKKWGKDSNDEWIRIDETEPVIQSYKKLK